MPGSSFLPQGLARKPTSTAKDAVLVRNVFFCREFEEEAKGAAKEEELPMFR